ncbi:MAG: hypothetical protein HYZ49_11495 [Chloroflexi bacterium]|nr:hypothetical protein [Chloroflexota bacterium]
MPKTFYTEHDIEDLAARGVTALDVNDDVVLTDLAREKALNLGLKLVRSAVAGATASRPGSASTSKDEVAAKVKAAVIARLGNGVDPTLLDAVITRVVAQIK